MTIDRDMRSHFTAVFPTTEIGTDPGAIRAWAAAAEDLSFGRVAVYDHVLGVEHTDRPRPIGGPYTDRDQFHEPMVLLGYLAAVTKRVELMTGVLVLPQRQAALVAKQAAEIQLLSGGRLVLGVGVGWNHVEFGALGMRFDDRGRRVDEQVNVIRQLWDRDVVDIDARFHRIERAGIAPRPHVRIPIWYGGSVDAAFARTIANGDGHVFAALGRGVVAGVRRLHELLAHAGRAATSLPVEATVHASGGVDRSISGALEFLAAGGTHLAVNTMTLPSQHAPSPVCVTVDDHIRLLAEVREALGSAATFTSRSAE